jgi:hypothetical protein
VTGPTGGGEEEEEEEEEEKLEVHSLHVILSGG